MKCESLLEDVVCELKRLGGDWSEWFGPKTSTLAIGDLETANIRRCKSFPQREMRFERKKGKYSSFRSFTNTPHLIGFHDGEYPDSKLKNSKQVKQLLQLFDHVLDELQIKKKPGKIYSTRRLQFIVDEDDTSIEKCCVISATWKAEWVPCPDPAESGGGLCGEGEGRTALGGGSVRIHHLTGVSPDGQSRFPKLEECAHFHYDHVELGTLQLSLCEDESLRAADCDADGKMVTVRVSSSGQAWLLRRTYDNFHTLDRQLHRCVYDRKFSNLPDLPAAPVGSQEDVVNQLSAYMTRLSSIAGSQMNCAPVLSWFELDNRGRRLLVTEGDSCPINTPAVAAAYSIKKYNAVAADEISFDIGDMISVIDMPPPEESAWWRGKRGFLVGFFPSHCVAVITDKLPRNLNLNQSLTLAGPTKPVLRNIKQDIGITPPDNVKKYFSKRGFNLIPVTGMIDLPPNEEGHAMSDDINTVKSVPGKHGKLIAFFRAFILSRPSRRRLKQSGILKERVFGCDLGEHLLNSGNEIPMVLKCCSEFIESHGIVDGIYRLSGVTSNIQKIRRTFDEDQVPALYEDEAILQDIHSVASLLKMYFRELPNPLCTYQLYDAFVQAVSSDQGPDDRLLRMRQAVQKLPPPHYRTLEYLMRHLARVSERGSQTGMTARNVAIVWAPNLLRCKELEVGGVAALQGVGVQAVVTEFLIVYADLIFCSAPLPSATPVPTQVTPKRVRPKSLAISTPTKLLTLEEAQSRALAAGKPDQDYIEVGGGPSCLPAKYHTVIEFPRKRAGSKRSPLGWKSFFSKSSRQSNESRAGSGHKSRASTSEARKTSVPTVVIFGHEKALTESDLTSRAPRRLRPVKSAESLASGQSSARSSSCLEPPSPPTPPHTAPPGHNRSVSHDSYFDTLVDTPPHRPSDGSALLPEEDEEGLSLSLDLSELQVNFDLEESEMRIFSEDETNQLFSSHNSLDNKSVKRQPLLARAEDSSADPSPKKHKTGSNGSTNRSKRSRLEERLSNAELRYIDSGSPEQVQTQAEVHGSPPQDSHSPSLAEATVSENESLTLSGLTTPDTPTPRPNYTPLTEDSLSDVVTTPEYRKLTPMASPRYENLPRDRLSYPGEQRPRYENVSRDRLSFQGVLKNGDLGMCETRPNDTYEHLNGEKFCTIDCDLTTEIMDTIMAESKIKDEEAKYEEIKESSIYESVEDDKKLNFYENVTASLKESELYEPIIKTELGSSYEEISTQECLVSERLQCGGISSSGSLVSPVGPMKENEYECLVVNSSPDDSKPTDPNHNLNRALPLAPSAPTANLEENVYEDIQTVSQADSQVYQQVKYLRRSVHEINQLLEESMEPFTGEDVSSLEEEDTALVSPINNESAALSSVNVINTSSPLDPTTSFSKRFEEARLRSSCSSDLPTVQTESVTSVSNSPLVETDNWVSTNGSDKDLLYENSTMDDVEAISTSYEEPGRSIDMLYENSKSALERECLQEDRVQSVEMIYENSKSLQELLLCNQTRSVEMLCEESTSNSTQDSLRDAGKSEDMLFEYSNSKSKDSLEDQGQNIEMLYENSGSNLIQESLVGHENTESSKNNDSSNSEKDTDKQIDCQFSDLNSMGTSIDSPSIKYTQSLDENKRKFESEIGRDIVRERKMRQELEANSSSTTGQTTSSGRNVQDLMSRFEWSRSDKDSLPPCMKARLSRQSSKDNVLTLTTSLDASSFPSDNNPLTRVKTSPDLITGQDRPKMESSQDSEVVRRERIEKYKEERRTFLRNKYRTDSFNNNDDKDEEMIRRLKAKANVRASESMDDSSVPGGETLNSLEWTARRSPSRKQEEPEPSFEHSREKELERRLSDHKSDTSSLKRSPSKTLVSISYSPTKTKAPGSDFSSVKCNKPSEINRIPDRIVFNRSVSLNSNPVNLKDTRSSAGSDKTRCRPDDLNLSGISAVKKRDENVSPRVIRMERKPWKGSEGEGGCHSPNESLVQRRVNQLSASSGDQADNSVKRRTSLTDLVKPASSLRARANSGSAKSPSYCIKDMAALFENRDIK